tara:strand:- start:1592 stop:2155 length:564 start_codon:yes stop_codon:yes gene_type:complete
VNLPHHGKYKWLPILYNMIKILEPKKIVEFGAGKGPTTVTMAKALKDNNIDGKINSYDLWVDEYWGNYESTLEEYKKWEVCDYINLQEKDFYEWIKTDEHFDFLYFDIDNNGDKILDLYEKTKYKIEEGSVIMFEGGSVERDNHGVIVSGSKKMNDVKNIVDYKVLTDNIKYSLSIIYNKDLYNLEY